MAADPWCSVSVHHINTYSNSVTVSSFAVKAQIGLSLDFWKKNAAWMATDQSMDFCLLFLLRLVSPQRETRSELGAGSWLLLTTHILRTIKLKVAGDRFLAKACFYQ